MSIYNRKMFKRNARNALNSSAGIAPVQKFTSGGFISLPPGVSFNQLPPQLQRNALIAQGRAIAAQNRRKAQSVGKIGTQSGLPPLRFNPSEASQLTRLRTAPTTLERITRDLPFDKGASAFAQNLMGTDKRSDLAGRMLQLGLGGAGQLADYAIAGGKGVASLFQDRPDKGAGTKAAPAVLAPGVVQSLNDPSKPIPDDLLGVDLLTIPGVEAGTPPPVPRGTAPGQSVQITPEGAKFKARPETPFDVFKADTEMTNIDMGPEEAEMQRIAMADADMPNPRAEQDFQAAVDAADRDEQDQQEATLQQQKQDTGTGTGTGTGGSSSPNVVAGTEAAAQQTAADQVSKTFDKTASDLIAEPDIAALKKEFLDQMPEYEGTNPGLFLAQIGFKMAAGKSPNAIENIANAMDQVLPSIIADGKERKAYKRQLDLSAAQYALGEVGKHRASIREMQKTDRNLKYFVAKEDIPGKAKKGDIMSFTEGDIRNGVLNEFPVTDITIWNNDRDNEAIIKKASEELKKTAKVKPKDVDKMMLEYREAANQYTQFGGLRLIVESNITKVATKGDEFLGGLGILKNAALKAVNTVYKGDALPDNFKDRKTYQDDMRNVANQMVREILGESAKNISNIDRKLADEVSGLVQDLTVGETPSTVIPKLQRLLTRIDTIQSTADQQLNDLENTWRGSIVEGSGVNVYDLQQRSRQRLTGTGGAGSQQAFATGGGQTITFGQITDDAGNFSQEKFEEALKGLG